MIAVLKQTKTNFDLEYRCTAEERELCTARAPFQQGNLTTALCFPDGRESILYFNPHDKRWGAALKERLSFKIIEQGTRVGSLRGASRRTGLFRAYPYYMLDYHGREYEMYAVGLGAKGLYLCLYQGGQLFAMADKALTTVNYRDSYTLYLEQEALLPLTLLAVLYYDLTCCGDLMEQSVYSVRQQRVHTIQKELLAKYDAGFIPRILAQAGKTD